MTEDYVNNPYYLKEWSQKEIEVMVAKAVKPLQERVDVLEQLVEKLAKSQVKDWNELYEMIRARTSNNY